MRQGDKVEIKLTSRLWKNTLLKVRVFDMKNIGDLEGCCLMKPKALKTQLTSFRGILRISVATIFLPEIWFTFPFF